jgi:hypothetical protein
MASRLFIAFDAPGFRVKPLASSEARISPNFRPSLVWARTNDLRNLAVRPPVGKTNDPLTALKTRFFDPEWDLQAQAFLIRIQAATLSGFLNVRFRML